MKTHGSLGARFFAGSVEYVFHSQLGVADPRLIDYLSALLVRFIHMHDLYAVRGLSGRRIVDVAGMLEEAQDRVGCARRKVCCHIGDFTLFWTGIYPESLRELQSPDKKDCFIDYCSQGKRAYFLASRIDAIEDGGVSRSLLVDLSERFELCSFGLREVRREWESRDDEDIGQPLLL